MHGKINIKKCLYIKLIQTFLMTENCNIFKRNEHIHMHTVASSLVANV